MLVIDPAWAGKVQFYELLFGTWTVYVALVLVWEKVLGAAGRVAVCAHEFHGSRRLLDQSLFPESPSLADHAQCLHPYLPGRVVVGWGAGSARSVQWQIFATLWAVPYTLTFIGFEQLARLGVEGYGVNEFWFMAGSFFGFIGLILWRGRQSVAGRF